MVIKRYNLCLILQFYSLFVEHQFLWISLLSRSKKSGAKQSQKYDKYLFIELLRTNLIILETVYFTINLQKNDALGY